MTEVYLLFYLATPQLFTNFNKFLQRDDPIVPVISDQLTSFLRKLLGKFVSVGAIKSAADITSVNYCEENQLPSKQSIFVVVYGACHTCTNFIIDAGLFIGITTRQLLLKMENDGDISPRQVKVFYEAVREFYTTATKYALANLPFKDELLQSASFVQFENREKAVFSQVEYFIARYCV